MSESAMICCTKSVFRIEKMVMPSCALGYCNLQCLEWRCSFKFPIWPSCNCEKLTQNDWDWAENGWTLEKIGRKIVSSRNLYLNIFLNKNSCKNNGYIQINMNSLKKFRRIPKLSPTLVMKITCFLPFLFRQQQVPMKTEHDVNLSRKKNKPKKNDT